MGKAVEINNLTKYYGKTKGIENVSFSIEKGEIFGFIGPNGAGKSTTIRTLLSLISPTSGTASIFGMDCQKKSSKIAKKVGYLPSEVFYYNKMKVKELLKYSASFYKKDCSSKMKALSERLELDVNRKIDDLSFGNKKKVGIVQGLLHNPELIILDEPTSGLDPIMQQEFFNIIQEENARGATVLMSSHILSEVQKICDKVAIIKDGNIVDVESMADIKNSTYKRVELQSKEACDWSKLLLDQISDLKIDDDKCSFIYQGDINSLIDNISALSLQNISITDPDLEELFLHYYS